MIVLERRIVWLFRAALKRCFETNSSRNDDTLMQIRLGKDGLTMHASAPEITVVYTDPSQTGDGVFTFPVSHFGEFEGRTPDPVEIALLRPNLAKAGWRVKDRTLDREIALSKPEQATNLSELPKNFTPLPLSFLSALHDASQSAANEPTKYVINRVQLRGKGGDVVGTDTRQLFVSSGFKFPFTDDVLIPRSGIFGLQPFITMEKVGIVRTNTHIFVRVGNWMFAFLIEKQGRYPDWSSIIPRSSRAETRFRLDAGDAQRFLDSLERRIKGPAAREITVTLDLMETPCLRCDEIEGRVTEVDLPNSEVTGKRLMMCLVLSQFLRVLEHRFQDFEIRDALKPLIARDGDRIYLSMPLSPNLALPPSSGPAKESTAPALSEEATAPVLTPSRAMVPVKRPRSSPIVVPNDSSLPAPANRFDILGEAEGLREGFFKVATHAGQILRFLRGVCTQQKLLDFARTSLLALGDQPTTGGKP